MKKIGLVLMGVILFTGCSNIDWEEIEKEEQKSYQDQEIDRAIDDALKDFDPKSLEGLE